MTESKRLKTEAQKYGIPVQTYALATLMAAGWTAAEAYALAYYENESFGASRNAQIRDGIVENPNFMEIVDKIRAGFAGVTTATMKSGKQLSKEDIADILQRQILALPDGDKAKTDAAVKYAELYAMKKEEVKDDGDEKIIHVFLPIPDNELEILVEKKARQLLEQQHKKEENI